MTESVFYPEITRAAFSADVHCEMELPMDTLYSVKLTEIIDEFHLEIIYAPEGYEKALIVADDVNRPGLQLAGFF